ncbi:hypothetical protein [Rhodanobacter sp. OK091]|uniref:hypothetical protein n=1 Tax=Rhodanobacter sp. OK091 TaxID=1881037 RepID=UPI0009113BA0|nr:hypothetical protein [Rhodanobacter sp. OK091]SHL61007.1 hypothetical protein SAMN05428972_0336 [Rhodanobacter sp. OK091]
MSLSHHFLRTTRTVHLYLGIFTAPMLLFFAITGGLQSFGLHEGSRGSSYAPPAWLASMAQLHKKQTTVMPVRRPRPPEVQVAASNPDAAAAKPSVDAPIEARATTSANQPAERADAKPKKNLLPMKIFFGLVSLGLLTSVLSGLYMAWRYSRKPRLFGTVLFAGISVPLLLLLF